MDFFPASSAKPLKSFKKSSDIVLKHKLTLAAVPSGVLMGVKLGWEHPVTGSNPRTVTHEPYPAYHQL